MIEFMDEDELIQEFHKAGIWMPGEWEAMQERRIRYEQTKARLRHLQRMLAPRAGPYHDLQRALAQQSALTQQRSSLFGGLLGGILP